MAANRLAEEMASSKATTVDYPEWLRWAALAWLLLWVPTYWHTWGAENFLSMCDIALILTCVGVWSRSALLLSSQAISSILVDGAWALDAAWRLFLGHHLIGGTEYLFDVRYPLGVRLLSLFHLWMPPLLLWTVRRVGYDRRGLALQSFIAFFVFACSRLTPPAKNMNFAFSDPFFHRAWGPPPLHVMVVTLFMITVVYLPTHLLLKKFVAPPHLDAGGRRAI